MGNVSRIMEILRKNPKETPEIKNNVTEMKNAFGGLISSLDRAEQRISELPICQQKLPKVNSREKKKTREKKKKKNPDQNVQKLWDDYKRHNKCKMEILE